MSHLAESASDGVHGMGSVASQDYEEGVWTPHIIGSTTAGVNLYNLQNGLYYRLGNYVFVSAWVQIVSKDINMSGAVRITGLPFTPLSNYPITISRFQNVIRNTDSDFVGVTSVLGDIQFQEISYNGTLTLLNSSAVMNNSYFIVSTTYKI